MVNELLETEKAYVKNIKDVVEVRICQSKFLMTMKTSLWRTSRDRNQATWLDKEWYHALWLVQSWMFYIRQKLSNNEVEDTD